MPNKKLWKIQEISIKNLHLWDENARFPEEYFNKSEKELIQYLLSKKDFKIKDFAKEVVKDFDLPQLEKIVVLDINKKFVVIEGNRRLAVYKLLINPSLVRGDNFRSFFEVLKNKISINESFKLEANITSDKEEALRFVDRKHNRGNNEVSWNEPERRRFKSRRPNGGTKDIERVKLADSVKKLDLPENIREEVVGKGYVTTFYRIVDSDAAQKKLKYKFSNNGKMIISNSEQYYDILKVITFNVWVREDFDGKKINSRSLNTKDSIKEYLNKIKRGDVEKVDKEIKKLERKDLFGKKRIEKERSQKKQGTLAKESWITYKDYIYYKGADRVKDILKELKENKPLKDKNINILAPCLRIVIELAIYHKLKERGDIKRIIGRRVKKLKEENIKRKKEGKSPIEIRKGWAPTLKEMLKYILEEASNIITDPQERKAIDKVMRERKEFIESLDYLVHNFAYHPTKDQLENIWKQFGRPIFNIISKIE